jgi:chromosome segregation ATPase
LQAQDDAAASTQARLRQALRDTTSQLNDAQSQLAAAQAAQAQSEKDKAGLQAKLDALTAQFKTVSDQAATDKEASVKALTALKQGSDALVVHLVDALTTQINDLAHPADKNIAALHQAVDALKAQNPDLADALDQYGADIQSWVTGYNEYAQLENATEAQRAKLAACDVVLRRTVADRETKNLALYQLANEILTRYEKFGLGDALLAKEPFIGVSRVKLENLVQDYKDKLRDQVVVPGQAIAAVQPGTNSQASSSPGGTPIQR